MSKTHKPVRFDHAFRSFQEEAARLKEHVRRALKETLASKRAAWRMAKHWCDMENADHNKLVDLAKTSGVGVSEWLDQWFEPLTTLKIDYQELLVAIGKGMTQRAYLMSSASTYLAKLDATRRKGDRRLLPVPLIPTADVPIAEQLKQYRARCMVLEVENRELRQEVTALRVTVRRIQRAVGRKTG